MCIGTHSVDLFNRILFSAPKVVFLVVMLGFRCAAEYPPDQLMTLLLEQGPALSAIPVIFHFIWLPRQRAEHRQLHGRQHSQLRWVFIIGSAIPLIAYLLAAGDAGQHQLRHLRRHSPGAAGRAERPVAGGARCGGFAAR